MCSLEKRKSYTLSEVIELVSKQRETLENSCIYTTSYTSTASSDLICYIDSYPKITDDDEEQYPDFVIEQNLELFFYGQQFEDVITSITNERKSCTSADIIEALNYYLQNDSFMP